MNRSLVLIAFAAGCGASVGPAATSARVRVAHVSPGAPAVDFCLAPHGTASFTGPILAGAGRAAGLSYGTVTRYFDVEAARYDVRLVAPGATDCKQPLANLDDFTRLPELADGASATIAAEGTLSGQGDAAFAAIGDLEPLGHAVNDPPLRLAVFADDTAITADMVKLRFIHASPGTPAVDVGLGTGATFQRVFANVAFGKVAAHPPLENGYVQTAPFIQAVTARLAGSASDALTVPHVTFEPATISTAFAIGGKTGDPHNPLRVLLCGDNRPADGLLTSCTIAP
ncbi:MAG TPA: DUF4397 domain-containing protein [Kofleriaceae bacterium]|nr:DUF4397 domain-containing protein [Kofleriaceae bacterium]